MNSDGYVLTNNHVVAGAEATPEIARQFDLPPQTVGVVVTAVQPASTAEEAGLRRGDVIQEVDRKPTATPDQFQRAVQQAGNQPVLLLVSRDGRHLYIVVPARY